MTTEKFPWGEVVKVHTVGPHTITEYIVGPNWEDAGEVQFHTPGGSHDTLDEALLFCVTTAAGNSEWIYSAVHRLVYARAPGEED